MTSPDPEKRRASRPYEVRVRKRAERDLADLPFKIAERIKGVIDGLRVVPRPARSEKVQGLPDGYRIRVGDYRVVYTVADGVLIVYVIRIGHRKDIYRNL